MLAAVDAGVDAVDAAMDAMSGTTSQPALGSIVEALARTERETGLNPEAIRRISCYWEAVRAQYVAFESDIKAGASEVYLHEMPGGQVTNLKEQARSLDLKSRWHEVAHAYRAANDMFGDIVKVTPSSKVVGDMALMMVSQGLTPCDVTDPNRDVAFPASVVEMLRGDLGQPPGGWPRSLQLKALKGSTPIYVRPGSLLGSADLSALRADAETVCGRRLDEKEFSAYLMYPKVFAEFSAIQRKYGPVSVLPTPIFFYGMKTGDEISIEIEEGKALVLLLTAMGDTRDDGQVEIFFELNGQPRVIAVANRAVASTIKSRRKAEDGNGNHVAAPMPGVVSSVGVSIGQVVKAGDVLLTLEAMKMETVLHAPYDGTIVDILITRTSQVESKDLLIEMK